MLRKVIATQFGVDGDFIAPLDVLIEPQGTRVNIGVWATKESFEAGQQTLQKVTLFFGGEDNPFKLSDNAIRNKLKQAIKALPEFSDAVEDDT